MASVASSSSLPVLLPQSSKPQVEGSHLEWKPKRDLSIPLAAPVEDPVTQEQQMAMARIGPDGKVKKVRPRRTVDYGGPLGRWALVSFHFSCRIEVFLTVPCLAKETTAEPDVRAILATSATLHHRRMKGNNPWMYCTSS